MIKASGSRIASNSPQNVGAAVGGAFTAACAEALVQANAMNVAASGSLYPESLGKSRIGNEVGSGVVSATEREGAGVSVSTWMQRSRSECESDTGEDRGNVVSAGRVLQAGVAAVPRNGARSG